MIIVIYNNDNNNFIISHSSRFFFFFTVGRHQSFRIQQIDSWKQTQKTRQFIEENQGTERASAPNIPESNWV